VLVRAETDFQNGSALISSGSGFLYDNLGHIVTNNHVIDGASNQVAVNFINGTSYTGTVLGGDNYTDIAVIQINPSILVQEHASALSLADPNSLKIGQHVVAIGNPLEVSGTMTEGIISQLNNIVFPRGTSLRSGMIQTDTPFTHGSSGGPLLNLKGQVVGITTQHLVDAPFLAYAIPSGTIARVVPQLILHGSYSHPWLGIGGIEVTPRIARALGLTDARGIMVTDVVPGSPAAIAGISGGTQSVGTYGGFSINSDADVILSADNKKIRGLADLLSYIDTKSVGDTIVLSGVRSGKPGLVTVHLTARPQS
jgi:S1-C subfamily serine protease